MSTTFDVYPTSRKLPLFAEVACECRRQFNQFLAEVGLPTEVSIHFQLRSCAHDEAGVIGNDSEFRWSDSCYLWVGIDGLAGGTDGYYLQNDELDYQYWREDIIPLDRCAPIRDELETALQIGHHWNFRRSVGQPGVVNILYGLLAGSIGNLTGDFIFSDDGAWDYQRMPIRASDFLTSYFRPNKETDTEIRRWAIRSIDCARKELAHLKER